MSPPSTRTLPSASTIGLVTTPGSVRLSYDTFTRDHNGQAQSHTRTSVLRRLFSHDAYHCGELSQTLGIHGLPQIDLWPSE